MDAHSKWPEVYNLNTNSTSAHIITKLRETFVRFGIPDQIVSDNGTQFTSQEFQEFCKFNGIKHTTSSVYHPRSNGEAERFVQTFKKSMKEASVGNWELTLQRFLFTYRLTPHATTGSAPCELLQGRKLKCVLDLVRPNPSSKTADSQRRQEKSYNKKTRTRTFQIGQRVWVKTFSKNLPLWSMGVIHTQKGPLTFVVSVDGVMYRRHQDHILDAGPEISFDYGEGVEPDARIDPQSPARPQPGTPRVATPVPIPVYDVTDSEDDSYQEANDELYDPPLTPPAADNAQENRTPRSQRPKRVRNPVVKYQAGSNN